jgi:hypothetical protein
MEAYLDDLILLGRSINHIRRDIECHQEWQIGVNEKKFISLMNAESSISNMVHWLAYIAYIHDKFLFELGWKTLEEYLDKMIKVDITHNGNPKGLLVIVEKLETVNMDSSSIIRRSGKASYNKRIEDLIHNYNTSLDLTIGYIEDAIQNNKRFNIRR